jgi:hypothetical protein
VSRYEAVVARVGALATYLHRLLYGVTTMLAVGAIGLFVGVAMTDEWKGSGLTLGGVLAGAALVATIIEARFNMDVARVRDLPNITHEDLAHAARQLQTSAVAGERQLVEAHGFRKLIRLALALRILKADVDALAEGGMAPAVALGRALRPSRLLLVGVITVASPFVLAFGLAAVILGLTL